MIIFEDTRNQITKHKNINKYFAEQGIEVIRTKLLFGDYSLHDSNKIVIDTKKDLLELCGNVTQQHDRFKRELLLAKKCNSKLIILVEEKNITCLEDIKCWTNPRDYVYCTRIRHLNGLSGTKPTELYKILTERQKSLRIDLNGIRNDVKIPKPPVSGEQLYKTLSTIQSNTTDYNVSFEFCNKADTGKIILELLGGKNE